MKFFPVQIQFRYIFLWELLNAQEEYIQKRYHYAEEHISNFFYSQWRTQGGFGVKNPALSLIFYKLFITCAKEIKSFRILFAC